MNYKNLEKRLISFYIFWELFNLMLIEYAKYHMSSSAQSRIMFASVCVNTMMMAYCYQKYGRKKPGSYNLLAAALAVTLTADLFLTLLGITLPGYLLFCLVESIYAIYFGIPGKGGWNILIRSLLYIISVAVVLRAGLFSLENAFGILNLTLLAANVFCAWFHWTRNRTKETLLAALGMTLFAGCDFSLLIMALAAGNLYVLADYMVWIFYVPSQVLLVLTYYISGCGAE